MGRKKKVKRKKKKKNKEEKYICRCDGLRHSFIHSFKKKPPDSHSFL